MADIIYEDGKILMVKPDKEITREQLQQRIDNLKEHRGDMKEKREKLKARLQEIQKTITEYEDVLSQAGGV